MEAWKCALCAANPLSWLPGGRSAAGIHAKGPAEAGAVGSPGRMLWPAIHAFLEDYCVQVSTLTSPSWQASVVLHVLMVSCNQLFKPVQISECHRCLHYYSVMPDSKDNAFFVLAKDETLLANGIPHAIALFCQPALAQKGVETPCCSHFQRLTLSDQAA